MSKDFETFKKQAKEAAKQAGEEYRPYREKIEEKATLYNTEYFAGIAFNF